VFRPKDSHQAALATVIDIWHAAHGACFLPALGHDKKIAFLLCYQHAAIRQKRHRPGLVERGDNFDIERQLSLCLRVRACHQEYAQYRRQ